MNPTLRNLLITIGAVTTTGLLVWTYAPSDTPITFSQLQTAGTGINADCSPVVAVTREDVGPRLRARLLDAGAVLRPLQTHARLYRQAFRCPMADGGADLVVPGLRRFGALVGQKDATDEDDTQPGPLFEVARVLTCATVLDGGFCGNGPLNVALAPGEVPPCVRANFDAGLMCRRLLADGGSFQFGDGNVGPRGDAVAPNVACEAVECGVYYGEGPEVL